MGDINTRLFQYLFSFSHRSSLFDAFVSFVASYVPYLVLVACVFFGLSRKEWRTRVLFFIEITLATLIARGLIVECIKFFYFHSRPFVALDLEALVQASGNSFPSGHAAFFFALAACAFFANRTLGFWCFGIAAANGLARVIAGVHWPLDIAGGIIVGVVGALFAHALLAAVRRALKSNGKKKEVFEDAVVS